MTSSDKRFSGIKREGVVKILTGKNTKNNPKNKLIKTKNCERQENRSF